MKHIVLIKEFDPGVTTDFDKDLDAKELFTGPFRKIIEIRLKNGAVLSRHKAAEPITVFCVSGKGVFRAGTDMEDSQELRTGTFITLEGGIYHEVAADPVLHLIVSRFANN